jgi:predicted RecB family nuclease
VLDVTTQIPILLTGYDAKRCARRIHNEWDPAIKKIGWEVPADLRMRMDAGIAFEAQVFDELRTALTSDRLVDLSEIRGKAAAIEATTSAMEEGVQVILGGWLLDDVDGGRTGRPDVLLRLGIPGDAPGYVPGDVKWHKMTTARARGTLTYSRLGDPAERIEQPGRAAEATARFDDYLQLAHYWRMLEAMGRLPTAGSPVGFIIGTDTLPDLSENGHVLTWLKLDAPLFVTYSRSKGVAKRTALERYDHEQRFRLKVAAAAAAAEEPLVQPIFTDECDACPWYDYCRTISGPDVASAEIRSGRLSVREWLALGQVGVTTVDDLADLDVDDNTFQGHYLPEVSNIKDPMSRLADAVRRARMTLAGVTLERETTGQITVPRADIEIDFDIEWDTEDHVYLWGAMVSRPGEAPTYHPVVAWEALDASSEVGLAQQFADWLRAEIAAADQSGQSLLVYHYSHPEPAYLERLLGEANVADLTSRFVDLLPIIREHYFGLHGLGIKKVAPAFGFGWRDEDPGGLQSQLWLIEARQTSVDETRDAGRARILTYNEDDVRATASIRNGL